MANVSTKLVFVTVLRTVKIIATKLIATKNQCQKTAPNRNFTVQVSVSPRYGNVTDNQTVTINLMNTNA